MEASAITKSLPLQLNCLYVTGSVMGEAGSGSNWERGGEGRLDQLNINRFLPSKYKHECSYPIEIIDRKYVFIIFSYKYILV